MDVIEHDPILHLKTQIKVKEYHYYCNCSTFHSRSSVYDNVHSSHPIMSGTLYLYR
jgi:hypothetical protein